MNRLEAVLQNSVYPGRGIILGTTSDETSMVIAYFITGRSDNSRNRVLELDNKAVRTKAFDESKLIDPSLIIYYPVRICGNIYIITNGDQTDTICQYIREGHSFENALRTRTYEPDTPLFTPRISGIMDLADGSYHLAILKNEQDECLRFFYEYPAKKGIARYISTYIGDELSPEPFIGEPYLVSVEDNIDDMTSLIWNNLDERFRVSLFVRYIDCSTKEITTRIINKNLSEQ
ncbi:MAG: IMP cyclohydrolase [Oscillospiraceae bacterium]|nr:IMP cyclohydrolase [Oscillospiraceae bacterium]